VYGTSIPDRIVGGDFFDYLQTDGETDRLPIVIGDAASKGLRAASQALYLVGGLRMAVSYHAKITTLMARLNQLLHLAFSEEHFVSMFYVELFHDRNGLLLYANAGHNSPFIYHASDQRMEVLEPTGQVMGPFPDGKYVVENTYLQPGDILLMYTDGISEARDSSGNTLYGEQRILEYMKKYASRNAEEICKGLLEEVQKFARGSDETDDKTIVVVKRNK
jgi:sigma-B regulation protein RsbU (phosphoserine phosphatase)